MQQPFTSSGLPLCSLCLTWLTFLVCAACCIAYYSSGASYWAAFCVIKASSAAALWIGSCFASSSTRSAAACLFSSSAGSALAFYFSNSRYLALAASFSFSSASYALNSSQVKIILQLGLATALLMRCFCSSLRPLLRSILRSSNSVCRAMSVSSGSMHPFLPNPNQLYSLARVSLRRVVS